MKFMVSRTSIKWQSEMCPCENAVFDNEEGEWIIEINSIEELLSFAEKCNEEIIISPKAYKGFNNKMPRLEIYDDWRE